MKHLLRSIVLLAVMAATAWGSQSGSSSKPAVAPTDQTRDDKLASAALTRLGVPLQRDTLGRVRWIEAFQGEFNDEAMRYLSGLPRLEWLAIGGGTVTPQGIAFLKGCSSLTRLYVRDVRLSDDSLRVLGNLTRLEALSLQGTGISGNALKHIRAAGLTVLNLSGNDINDNDMAEVARFARLEVLALANTKITGAGLAKLEGMKRLNVLNLTNCRIVDNDLEHFTSMPNLRIVHAAGCKISSKTIELFKEKLPMLAIFQ